MKYERERKIRIDIIGIIQDAELELDFEIDASQEAGLAEMIFNKLELIGVFKND